MFYLLELRSTLPCTTEVVIVTGRMVKLTSLAWKFWEPWSSIRTRLFDETVVDVEILWRLPLSWSPWRDELGSH